MQNPNEIAQKVREKYQNLAAEKAILEAQLTTAESEIAGLENYQNTIFRTTEFLKKIVRDAQTEFKKEVDAAVTMAVKTMFDEAFYFDLEIKQTTAGLQCTPRIWEVFEGTEVEYIPKDEMGGSILDPIGFAFRVTLQMYDPNPTRPTFIMDEPMKNVGKGELLERAGQLLREISHNLKRQLIIITHEPELAEIADRAWRVVRVRGKSTATVIKDTAQPKRKLVQ